MRNTSRILGIIGSIICFFMSMILLFGGATFLDESMWSGSYYDSPGASAAGLMFIAFGIAAVSAGVLGLIGSIIVKRKNTASGVMMIIAAVLSLCTFFNVVAMILFIIGAVMAFKREPQPVMVPYPFYPPAYYPYPPQYPPYPPHPQPTQGVPYPPHPQPPQGVPYPPHPQPPQGVPYPTHPQPPQGVPHPTHPQPPEQSPSEPPK